MTQHAGVEIREVWDWRLSTGAPILFNKGKTWIVKIFANDGSGVLDEYDTGVKTTGDNFDCAAIAACYDWLRTVRDEYSRDHIELRKPLVAEINATNEKAAKINGEAIAAKAENDTDLFNQKNGELQAHLAASNAVIKGLTQAFHAEVAQGGDL